MADRAYRLLALHQLRRSSSVRSSQDVDHSGILPSQTPKGLRMLIDSNNDTGSEVFLVYSGLARIFNATKLFQGGPFGERPL